MHQSDVENVVASSGTALTEEQIKLIKRFTENVTVLFDGDAAGIKAALRGIDLILKGGLNVRVVLLPDNDDPDSYSRKVGTTEFQKYLAQKSQDFISFKSGLFAAEAGNDPIRKAESIKEIVGSIALIPDPIKRSVYLQETSHQLKIAEPVLLTELNKLLIDERRRKEKDKSQSQGKEYDSAELVEQITDPNTISPDTKDVLYYPEREAIRLMLNYMDNAFEDEKVVDFMIHELDDVVFTSEVFRDIYNHFHEAIREGRSPSSDELILNGSAEVKNAVAGLMTSKYQISPNWKKKHIFVPEETENLSNAVTNNVLFLKFRIVQKMISDNLLKIREAESAGNNALLEETMVQQQALKNAERELAMRLTIVVAR